MRLALLAVVLWWSIAPTAHAQPVPAGPPSKTLERAIKLYDKQDFYSASVELQKVLDGESGDDAANKQRAEFFQGKTLFQMKYYAASLAYFDKIANLPAHTYHVAALKWLVAIGDAVPTSMALTPFAAYEPEAADDPMFDAKTRDAVLYYLGRASADRDSQRAAKVLRGVTGSYQPAAALELAKLAFREQHVPDAIAQLEIAARNPALVDDAIRTLATWTRLLKDPPGAHEALVRVFGNHGLAKLESSRQLATAWFPDLPGVSIETFNAVAIATFCTRGPSANGVPELRATVDDLEARATKLMQWDDSAEAYEAVEKAMASSPALRLALLDASTRDDRVWVIELGRELADLQRADKAWQTTQVAAIVLQELIVQQTVAQADVGKRYRNRLDTLGRDLPALARVFGKGVTLSLGGAVRDGRGIAVDASLCSSQLGMPASALATPGTATPIPTTPVKATGCAGCASGRDDGGLLLLVLGAALAWPRTRWGRSRKDRTSTSRR